MPNFYRPQVLIRSVLVSLMIFAAGCNTVTRTPSSTDSPSTPASTSSEDSQSGQETIAILGTNDIHGTIAPAQLKTREKFGIPSVNYEIGGIANIASYVNILRSEYQDRFIWLDAGDEFQGSLDSNLEHGAPMVQFFNQSKLTAAAIGNHEFDYGLPILSQRMKEAQYPYLQANIFNQNGQDLYPFPNTYPHIIKQVGRLRVGIIGLTTLQTATTTQPEHIKGLHFGALKTAVLKESQFLRKQGAHVVLLLAHAGLDCETSKGHSGIPMWKSSDPQGKCHDEGEIVELLKSLPKGTTEGVISGHYHKLIHHWIAGVPVLQAGAFGYYLNVLYLTYDFKHKKLLSNQTRIEGPIPVCTRVFANQHDCDGDRPAPKNGRGPLIPYSFHGKPISADAEISQLTQEVLHKTQNIKDRKLAIAVRPIENPPFHESDMGNLTADAMRYVSQADFAIINGGGIRAPLEAGPITYGALYKSIPFENTISVIKIKANELRNIMQTLQSGDRYLSFVSGFIVKLRDLKLPAPFVNFAPSGMPEAWGHDRLIDILSLNGTALDPNAFYSLAIPDFLVHGGANLEWVMSQIPSERITWSIGLNIRDAVVKYLEFKQEVNTSDHPLVQPNFRRIQFVIPTHRPSHKPTHKSTSRSKESSPRAARQ